MRYNRTVEFSRKRAVASLPTPVSSIVSSSRDSRPFGPPERLQNILSSASCAASARLQFPGLSRLSNSVVSSLESNFTLRSHMYDDFESDLWQIVRVSFARHLLSVRFPLSKIFNNVSMFFFKFLSPFSCNSFSLICFSSISLIFDFPRCFIRKQIDIFN